MDNDQQEENLTPESEEFDMKAALSGRDKKINSQAQEIELLTQKLADSKPNSELEEANESEKQVQEAKEEEPPTSLETVIQEITRLKAELKEQSQVNETYRKKSISQMMGVKSRFNDDDFVAWADKTPISPYIPNSPTVGAQYLEFMEAGNTEGMEAITREYDNTLGINNHSPAINNHISPVSASKLKKDSAKAAELIKKAENAMQTFNYNDAKKFRSEAERLINGN